jgi:hypothetical protein
VRACVRVCVRVCVRACVRLQLGFLDVMTPFVEGMSLPDRRVVSTYLTKVLRDNKFETDADDDGEGGMTEAQLTRNTAWKVSGCMCRDVSLRWVGRVSLPSSSSGVRRVMWCRASRRSARC